MLANGTSSGFSINAREFSNDRHSQRRRFSDVLRFYAAPSIRIRSIVAAVETKATDVRCADARSDRLLVDSGSFSPYRERTSRTNCRTFSYSFCSGGFLQSAMSISAGKF